MNRGGASFSTVADSTVALLDFALSQACQISTRHITHPGRRRNLPEHVIQYQ